MGSYVRCLYQLMGIERIFKMSKSIKGKSNLIDGFVFLTSAIALLAYALITYNTSFTKEWSQSPSLFPLIVSLIMVFLSISLIFQELKKIKNENSAEVISDQKNTNLKGVAVVFIIILLYYTTMVTIKIPIVTIMISTLAVTLSIFEVATIFLLTVLMWYLGVRKASVLILTSVLSTLFVSIAFRSLLHVLLP